MTTPGNRPPKADRAAIKNADPALSDATNTELDAALRAVDQDAVYDEVRANYEVRIWDRKSSINNVPAQYFLDRDDVDENGDDDIYLLLQGGQVVGFQPHDPGTPGLTRIPRGQGQERGNKHADELATGRARAEVARRVREHVENSRRNRP